MTSGPRILFYFLIYLIVSVFNGNEYSFAQSEKDKLQKQKRSIENEITFTNKLLEETKKSKINSFTQLKILESKIGNREALIITMNAEIMELSKQIIKNQQTIQKLTEDLEILKEEYTEMIYQAYKNRSAYDRLMFIFAAENFNQAYQRLKYLQQYSIYRKKQAELIQNTQTDLQIAIKNLEKQKARKVKLLHNQQNERNLLTAEKNEKNITIKKLQTKESELVAAIKAKERAAAELQKKIQAIIDREILEASKKASASKTPAGTIALTPKERELSKTFSTNRGKLPWPIEMAIVSSTFGPHKHPDFKDVYTNNNGIDLLTNKGAIARAVFDGTVTAITFVQMFNYVVIVKHGEYYSVYANLSEVFVKVNDEIKTKQSIGIIYTNETESKTELHFELRKENNRLNPLEWLAGKK